MQLAFVMFISIDLTMCNILRGNIELGEIGEPRTIASTGFNYMRNYGPPPFHITFS